MKLGFFENRTGNFTNFLDVNTMDFLAVINTLIKYF